MMKESKEKIKNEKIHRKCKFGHCEKRSMERIRGEQQTLVSENSETMTMYKLKGKSLNMRTEQGFKKKNWSVLLVCPAGPSS